MNAVAAGPKTALQRSVGLPIKGVRLDDSHGTFRYYVADLARKLARKTLLSFLEGRTKLDPDWLLQLELGLV